LPDFFCVGAFFAGDFLAMLFAGLVGIDLDFFTGRADLTGDCFAFEGCLEARFLAEEGVTRDGRFGKDLATGTPYSFQQIHPKKPVPTGTP
jgi:hypothetical protein